MLFAVAAVAATAVHAAAAVAQASAPTVSHPFSLAGSLIAEEPLLFKVKRLLTLLLTIH